MPAPGWFGKLSSLGDFASRRLPPDWVQGCDRWLSAGMAFGERQRGEAWWPAYLAAPVWRFAWAPGVMDSQWWFGVLMPSCDKVGRYFPLVVALPRSTPPADRLALDHLDLWWAQAARAALDTLSDQGSVDAFEAALEDLPPWPGTRVPWASAPHGHGRSFEVHAGAGAADLAQELALSGMQLQLAGCTLWWPWREGAAVTQTLVLPGLPEPTEFVALMSPSPGPRPSV